MTNRVTSIRQAVADASDPGEPSSLEDVARSELANLWNDLESEQRAACNGVWSMRCDHLVYRIVRLSRLVGATPWEEIQVPTLLNGVYEQVHQVAGIDYPPVDWARVHDVDAYLKAQASRH